MKRFEKNGIPFTKEEIKRWNDHLNKSGKITSQESDSEI